MTSTAYNRELKQTRRRRKQPFSVMLKKCVLAVTVLELNLSQHLGHKKTKLNNCHHMLTSSTQLQNRSFNVVERTRTSSKCQKTRNTRAKRAKILFFLVKYANLWGFCYRCRRGCLSSLMIIGEPGHRWSLRSSAQIAFPWLVRRPVLLK